jgi:hypothetical protein
MNPSDDPKGEPPKQRKAERVNMQTFIHVRKSGYHRAEVTLLDISPVGCRIDLPERVAVGETVWVTLPGLQSIEGKVMWTRDWFAGVEFASPLYPSVFDAVIARLQK